MSNEPGNRYNIQLINALVLYVGTQAIAHIHNKGSTPSMSTITHSAHMDIFQNLAVDLDTEGKMQKNLLFKPHLPPFNLCLVHIVTCFCPLRPLSVPECDSQSAALSKQPHTLL